MQTFCERKEVLSRQSIAVVEITITTHCNGQQNRSWLPFSSSGLPAAPIPSSSSYDRCRHCSYVLRVEVHTILYDTHSTIPYHSCKQETVISCLWFLCYRNFLSSLYFLSSLFIAVIICSRYIFSRILFLVSIYFMPKSRLFFARDSQSMSSKNASSSLSVTTGLIWCDGMHLSPTGFSSASCAKKTSQRSSAISCLWTVVEFLRCTVRMLLLTWKQFRRLRLELYRALRSVTAARINES
jgi:hypothetical protein